MTFEQALEFIHQTGNFSHLGLERMEELLGRLGNPQKGLRFVHVAGTNGKGSTCAMLASILCRAGCKTGLYTSPHLTRVTERIQIDGAEISNGAFAALADALSPAVERMADKPTEFERLTAMGLLYFFQQKCDVVVLEVGLGGRLDATNVIAAPEAAVVANIGLEHTEWLGNTVEQIAFEKGGVIKEGRPAVLYGQSQAVEGVVRAVCAQRHAPLTVSAAPTVTARSLEGQRFDYRARKDLFLPLLGAYQVGNAALALDTVDVLRGQGWSISEDAIYQGLAQTRWPGRMEVLSRQPLVLLDGAHNPNGVAALAGSLREFLPGRQVTLVMGVMADKDFGEMLALMAPFARQVVAAQPDYYRALSSQALAEVLRARLAVPVYDGGSVSDALGLALTLCGGEPVCVFGSLYQAGEVRAFFGKD